ncbi:Nodulation protein NolG [Phytophthora palmivora]|uniref:Nodulation protein NolG n=1 Tax=Phytophthora palmivora TaxID=4796 RepID=A0A2P4Y0B9_9STRA|nr:Nodulation protein NolG [Phytophthora palmivora]
MQQLVTTVGQLNAQLDQMETEYVALAPQNSTNRAEVANHPPAIETADNSQTQLRRPVARSRLTSRTSMTAASQRRPTTVSRRQITDEAMHNSSDDDFDSSVAALAACPVMQVRMTGDMIDNVRDDVNNLPFDHSNQHDIDERIYETWNSHHSSHTHQCLFRHGYPRWT